jgi:hypothetical protein
MEDIGMAKKNNAICVLFVALCVLFPGLASAAEYTIHKGEIVSQIVLKLTGNPDFRRDGISVVTDHGRAIARSKFDYVRPDWKVVVEDKLIKTVRVERSAGKTLAQVCNSSVDPRCVPKLAKLNSIVTSRMSK